MHMGQGIALAHLHPLTHCRQILKFGDLTLDRFNVSVMRAIVMSTTIRGA